MPLAVVVSHLLADPHVVANVPKNTLDACSLMPTAIHRLRAWQHSA
jgi:hypothetical protein